jgi:hypothetical protein
MHKPLATALLGLALVAGCAEMRAPPPQSRLPASLAGPSADPAQAMLAEATESFADAGRSFAGQPARTARAAAQLEWLTQDFTRNLRWAALPPPVGIEMRAARLELRVALGTRIEAPPDAVVLALANAATALSAGNTAAAAAALPASLFEPGGNPNLARLAAPGPLPGARNATALARDTVELFQRVRAGGLGTALDPNALGIESVSGLGGLR